MSNCLKPAIRESELHSPKSASNFRMSQASQRCPLLVAWAAPEEKEKAEVLLPFLHLQSSLGW